MQEPTSGAPLLPIPGLTPASATPPEAPPLVPIPPAATLPPPAEAASPLARGPIHLRADGPAEALDPSKLPPPMPARAAKAVVGRGQSTARRDAVIFGLVFLLVAGAGGVGYFYFTQSDVTQEALGDAREKLGEAAQGAAQIPAKAIDDAKAVIANAREKEQARIDAVGEGKEPPTERAIPGIPPAPVPPPSGENPATTTATTTKNVTAYAGDKPAATAPVAPAPQANARFQRYAEGIRISGVFQGEPGRALIDGRLVREGEMVEPNLGIKFADLEPETKHLVLQDATGAQVRVRY